jgi:glutamate synthase domain-containing protein 2/glutamate synthase domain-containing protein 1/glutamate synthase domain-containing protein 3
MPTADPAAEYRPGLPAAQGLYDPRMEHDSCGVGMICQIKGVKSHQIIRDGLQILLNLKHRGAYGCDASTGDGAGILMQMPHAFLDEAAAAEGIALPRQGDYGCGLVFLPPDKRQQAALMELCQSAVRNEGQVLLGWRPVPVNSDVVGAIARAAEPEMVQLFVGRGSGTADGAQFERKLYVIRKVIENQVRRSDLPLKGYFHIPSLSSRTLVYKGMFQADQIGPYFPDLDQSLMVSALALVHQRYSTNTFPTWDLAHPFRFICHNGEINTVRGNANWMLARQQVFHSELFGGDLAKLMPVVTPGASDSAIFDNTVELLYHTGRSLPHAIMMMIPEAWQAHQAMDAERKAFYRYHACMMEPWDGPASIIFTDGSQVGAVLDRNGLRPSRYTVTTDDRVIMGSETGVIDLPAAMVRHKGRLQPGRMFLVDLEAGRIIEDYDIKSRLARRKPYRQWLQQNLTHLAQLPRASAAPAFRGDDLFTRQHAFGYTLEDLKFIIGPMAASGKEPSGSMGDDTPPAILSQHPRLLYDYFRQLFAQVTNPPLDAIREKLVTSLATTLGAQQNLFQESPHHCRQLALEQPMLTDDQLETIRCNHQVGLDVAELETLFDPESAGEGLADALAALCREAEKAVRGGSALLILSDKPADARRSAIPMLLAVSGVHHHLIRKGLRTRCALIVETGEAREIHHFCCLIGYGAGAVNPYLALATVRQMAAGNDIEAPDASAAVANYIKAAGNGILKVMSKMGISTLQSYCGAQIFEAVGLSTALIDQWFPGTPSRIGGADLVVVAREASRRHRRAYGDKPIPSNTGLPAGGKYQWRRSGETHQYNPETIARLQQAVRNKDRSAWQAYSGQVDRLNRAGAMIRGLIRIKPVRESIPIDQVTPWTEIVKRFKTGAMSYGSISKEAHETLAIAMNRIGGKSNSGEGGEDPHRFKPEPDGTWRNSAIKQVASGRFGVTADYLINARELQIKMAQGAKPGEGGQLPGFKVYPWIAKTRHATPYVGLISPPPHHDIYSIEDLAQLIFDLKNANPTARVSVKLVSEVGVGTIAAGVVKGKADVVLISGSEGGTGASPLSAVKYGGLPWELGVAETHQTLRINGLRHKVVVECDGQLKSGRDVAIAALLGADEFGFGTSALVALGCVMMRVCHLNTCPVGIATQDPELRKKFSGRPEHVINFMRFVAEDLRQIMADLGFRSLAEMTGRVDCLDVAPALDHWKARGLDLSSILHQSQPPPAVASHCSAPADTDIGKVLDHDLIEQAQPALEQGRPVTIDVALRNTQRTVGTLLSSRIAGRRSTGIATGEITLNCTGTAGQSFCAFGVNGLSVRLLGDANDYFGKGLSGATLAVRPPEAAPFKAQENIIIGNVALYGATGGRAYICGRAGERFCVRNSGAVAVVEGVGDHGCEYMTGGRVVVLGKAGRNFAAGMSGGTAYVWDPDGDFGVHQCNPELVDLEPLTPDDRQVLQTMVKDHLAHTQSAVAADMLDNWQTAVEQFIKVMPRDYKLALERLEKESHGKTNRI